MIKIFGYFIISQDELKNSETLENDRGGFRALSKVKETLEKRIQKISNMVNRLDTWDSYLKLNILSELKGINMLFEDVKKSYHQRISEDK